jgi:hypothetical protein
LICRFTGLSVPWISCQQVATSNQQLATIQ